MSDFTFDNYISEGADTSRLCFVFGGRRPALFLKRELARRAAKSFISPAFLTMEDFMKELGLKPDTIEKKVIIKKKDLPQEEMKLIVLEKNY